MLRAVSATDLDLMRRIDELHLEFPFGRGADVGPLIGCRREQGLGASREDADGSHGIEGRSIGVRARPSLSRATRSYPYLLRGLPIVRPNQVWAMDITYIPMAKGFVYLAVVLDWFSRRVLSWRMSIT